MDIQNVNERNGKLSKGQVHRHQPQLVDGIQIMKTRPEICA